MDCDCNSGVSGICPHCGSSNLSNNIHNANEDIQTRIKENVILPELVQFNYPLEIKTEISTLYFKISKGKIKRGSPRRGYIYCCIVAICREKGIVFDATQIQNKLELKQHDINKAIKEVESSIGNAISLNIRDAIKTIITQIGVREECLNDILEIYEQCKKYSSRFNSSRTETLANALVYYYLKKHLPDFNEDFFFENSKISRDTIMEIDVEIEKSIKN